MNLFCVLLYIYFLIITVLYQHVNGSLNDNLLNFTLITYDENYELTGRHEYTYNYTTHLFNEFNQMKELYALYYNHQFCIFELKYLKFIYYYYY